MKSCDDQRRIMNRHAFKISVNDLLHLLPSHLKEKTIKRHPLIVMNADAETACTFITRALGFPCPEAIRGISSKIEQATQRCLLQMFPRYRSLYDPADKVAAFRSLEWCKEIVMISFYQAFTRLAQCSSVLWLHDGLWIPREVNEGVIRAAHPQVLQPSTGREPVFHITDLKPQADALLLRTQPLNHQQYSTTDMRKRLARSTPLVISPQGYDGTPVHATRA